MAETFGCRLAAVRPAAGYIFSLLIRWLRFCCQNSDGAYRCPPTRSGVDTVFFTGN